MTGAESNHGTFVNGRSFDGDIEVGRGSSHISDVERNATPTEAPVERTSVEGNNSGHFEDIDKWAISLATILEDVPQYMCNPGHPGKISRIPENLREADAKAYEPYILSIGPYHQGKPGMKKTEMNKRIILKCVLARKPEITLRDYLMALKSIEPKARSFYSGVEMESEKFIRMLLLDSIFILLKFCGVPVSREKINKRNKETRSGVVDINEINEQINDDKEVGVDNQIIDMMTRADESNEEFSSSVNYADPPTWFWALFVHDLLENQLPFFVLQKIYDLAYGNSETQLLDNMKYHIGNMLWDYTKLDSRITISPSENVYHLLHLCHIFFRPTLKQNSITPQITESSQNFRLGSAVQLYEAGVRFESRSNSTQHSLLDISFDMSGKMILPCLNVDDNTNSLLRNLIALEQMNYPQLGLDISSYAVLLLHLITTPEDANLLRRKGIIQHHLASDKEMMYLINRLSVGLAFDYVEDSYGLKPVFHELKRYTERKVPQWRAWLKHRYFYNPWTVISLLAAFLLLFLTALQTFYTVYSYYQ